MNPDIHQGKLILDNLLVNYYHTEVKNPKKNLLFLHGWRSNSTLWFHLFPKLIGANFQIYALDMPGFGQSEIPSYPLFLQNYVEVVFQFINKLKLSKPILIGHSHGGRVGIKLAAEHPEIVEKLVLVDSAGIKAHSPSLQTKRMIAKIVKPLFKIPLLHSAKVHIYKQMGGDDYVATPELTQTLVNILNEDLTPLLSKIKTETLLIWGENDTDTPLKDATIMKENIPNSKLEVIKNAGHYSFLDQPEAFITYLLQFI